MTTPSKKQLTLRSTTSGFMIMDEYIIAALSSVHSPSNPYDSFTSSINAWVIHIVYLNQKESTMLTFHFPIFQSLSCKSRGPATAQIIKTYTKVTLLQDLRIFFIDETKNYSGLLATSPSKK